MIEASLAANVAVYRQGYLAFSRESNASIGEFAWKRKEKKRKRQKKEEVSQGTESYFPEEGTLSSRELGAWSLTRILTLFLYVRKQDGLLPDRDYRSVRMVTRGNETPKNETMLTEFRKSLAVSVLYPLYTPNPMSPARLLVVLVN